MTNFKMEQIINAHPAYCDKLYCRGFLMTNAQIDEQLYPFYGQWKMQKFSKCTLLVHPKVNFYYKSKNGKEFLLVGHAYDPLEMEWNENKILNQLILEQEKGDNFFYSAVNQLTGVFTLIWMQENTVSFTIDASGMQTAFYTKQEKNFYICSHTALLGDYLELARNEYIERLTEYRFFPLLGNSLPGDLTPYKEVKRAVPNHYVTISSDDAKIVRFYWPQVCQHSLEELAKRAAELLHRSLQLIAKKWNTPAISMTGGCDSKTTLACAAGLYDKFTYFSYISSEEERVDAEAAHEICKALGLRHTIYHIPNNDDEIADVETVRKILYQNTGRICPNNPNDVRKRTFFADKKDFDVEVKSWASEIARAYYSKRFGCRKDFGEKPTPRKCTTLYKFFLHDRKLVKDTDKVFEEYLKKYFKSAPENPLPWQEQFFWEFRVPSWNGLVITGEHKYSFDITIPYNNRLLLELMLSVPIEDRISDTLYQKIRSITNPKVDDTGISVTNLKHTKSRACAENLYYTLHSTFPF